MRSVGLTMGVLLTLLFATTAWCQQQSVPGAPMRIRVGPSVAASRVISKVDPVYPPIAIEAHVSGTVTLRVEIGRDGTVNEVNAISGPKLMLQSAIDAVKQWRYQPMLLNGQPVEMETTVQIVYTLSGTPGQEMKPSVQIGTHAQAPAASRDELSIDPQLKADILKLLDVMQFRETGKATFENMYQTIRPAILRVLPETPNKERIADAYGEKLEALLTSTQFTDSVAAIYAHYLSDNDVKALTAFYETPAGQHYLAALPQIAGESNRIGTHIAAEHMMEILTGLCDEYPELKGKAGFCPAVGTERKTD